MDEAILLKYLQGKSNEQESKQVEDWCEASPDNRKTLEQIYYTLFLGDCAAMMNKVDTRASLREFKTRVRKKEHGNRQKSLSIRLRRSVTVAAAFFTGLILAGALGWGVLSGKMSEYTVSTGPGQRAQTILPDGSKIWLNASTKLVYRNSSRLSERQVDLLGEAYFEVAPDKKAPFVVNSKQIRTSVLGTKFNLRARNEENKVAATLFEGAVQVESPQTGDNGYLLKPGQTLYIDTDTYHTELVEYPQPNEVLLWMDGKLIFQQHSLLEITDIMEILYDVEFVYEDDSLKSERFTGEFSTDNTPTEILNILTYTNHFVYTKEGTVIRLSKK